MDVKNKDLEIEIEIEVEALEDRIAPGVAGSFVFSLRTHAGIRHGVRVDNHAYQGIRRASAASDAIFVKGLPPIIGKGH